MLSPALFSISKQKKIAQTHARNYSGMKWMICSLEVLKTSFSCAGLLVVNSRYSRVCNNWSWLTARKLLCKMCVHGSFKSFALLLTTTLLYENRFVVQNFALLQQQFEPQSTKSSPFFLLRNCNTHNHKIQLNLAWAHFLIYILLSFLCENMSLFSCLVFEHSLKIEL